MIKFGPRITLLLLPVLRLRQSRSGCGLSCCRKFRIAENLACCTGGPWAGSFIALRLFRFHGIKSLEISYIKKVECRELESLARGLEGLNGEPAHPIACKATSPLRPLIGLSRKRQNRLGALFIGARCRWHGWPSRFRPSSRLVLLWVNEVNRSLEGIKESLFVGRIPRPRRRQFSQQANDR